jgi:hypothetical protein
MSVPRSHECNPANGSLNRRAAAAGLAATASVMLLLALLSLPSTSDAADPPVPLGSAATYSVLGGQTVTNTGATMLSGDLGVSPGTAITGFPPGTVAGTVHPGDVAAAQAQSDALLAYNDAVGRAPTAIVSGDLNGQTLGPGVYNASAALALSGTLTLDGNADLDSMFVFQIGSTLTTASNIVLLNGAQACHVIWQIGSSATLGAASSLSGVMLAAVSITVGAATTIDGHALARDGSVTLDSDVFTTSACEATPITTTTTAAPVTTTTTAAPVTTTTTAAPVTTTTTAAPVTTTTTAVPITTTTTAAPVTPTTTATADPTDVGGGTGSGGGSDPPVVPISDLARSGVGSLFSVLLFAGSLLLSVGAVLLAFGRPRGPRVGTRTRG